MKSFVLTLSLFCLTLVFCYGQQHDKYGESFVIDNVIKLDDLGEIQDGKKLQIEGIIESNCVVKGCWMVLHDLKGEHKIRVKFKDYGFFVPTKGIVGKKAIINGVILQKEVSVQELRHLAEDAGKSPKEIAKISDPQVELSFIADGVVIE